MKYDTEFINLQKKLAVKFDKKAQRFISHMRHLREECQHNFQQRKEHIAHLNKDRITDLERKNKEIYDRIRQVRKEFREFLDKRQAVLEKKKKIALGKKDWSKPSSHHQAYLNYIKQRKREIHDFKKAFDWNEIKQREIRYVHERNRKMKIRMETDKVNSRKLDFFKNKKSF